MKVFQSCFQSCCGRTRMSLFFTKPLPSQPLAVFRFHHLISPTLSTESPIPKSFNHLISATLANSQFMKPFTFVWEIFIFCVITRAASRSVKLVVLFCGLSHFLFWRQASKTVNTFFTNFPIICFKYNLNFFINIFFTNFHIICFKYKLNYLFQIQIEFLYQYHFGLVHVDFDFPTLDSPYHTLAVTTHWDMGVFWVWN